MIKNNPMIKVFRKIRQRFLTENEFTKYLIYAIGEIILVVIGILIALQINNWNETRKNKALEIKILTNLKNDFRTTSGSLRRTADYIPLLISMIETRINYIGLHEDQLTQGKKDTLANTGYLPTLIVDGGLNALLGSNKLELISNDSLKNLLTQYPASVKLFRQDDSTLKGIVLNVSRPILESHVSITDLIANDVRRFPDLKNRACSSDYMALLNDRNYQNALVNERWHWQKIKLSTDYLLKETEGLSALIENEIEQLTK